MEKKMLSPFNERLKLYVHNSHLILFVFNLAYMRKITLRNCKLYNYFA